MKKRDRIAKKRAKRQEREYRKHPELLAKVIINRVVGRLMGNAAAQAATRKALADYALRGRGEITGNQIRAIIEDDLPQ